MSFYWYLPEFFKVAEKSWGIALVDFRILPLMLGVIVALILVFGAYRLRTSQKKSAQPILIMVGGALCVASFLLQSIAFVVHVSLHVIGMLGLLTGCLVVGVATLLYTDAMNIPVETQSGTP